MRIFIVLLILFQTGVFCYAESPFQKTTIMVVPFANLPENNEENWVGKGISESLMLGLREIDSCKIIENTLINEVLGKFDSGTEFDEKNVLAAAEKLKPQYVIGGSFDIKDSNFIIKPYLINFQPATAEKIIMEEVLTSMQELINTNEALFKMYLDKLSINIPSGEYSRIMRGVVRATNNPRAFQSFIKGMIDYEKSAKEDHENAVKHFTYAMQIDSKFSLPQYYLALAFFKLNNRWRGVTDLRNAIEKNPDFSEGIKTLGDMFLNSLRRPYDQAIEAYQKVLKVRPHNEESIIGIGEALVGKGNWEEAIGMFEKVLQIDPNNARIHYNIGKIYYNEKGLYYEAVSSFQKALQVEPSNTQVRLALGEIYEEKGLYNDAVDQYMRILQVEPRHTTANYNMAMALEKIDVKKAITQWETYLEIAVGVQSEKDWVDIARQHLKKLRGK